MKELRIIAVVLAVVGIVGVIAFAWMHCGPLLYRVLDVTVVESHPGWAKVRIERWAAFDDTIVLVLPELECYIDATLTLTPLRSETMHLPKGLVVYNRNVFLPSSAFNGRDDADCRITAVNAVRPFEFLPPLEITWRTPVFTAYRPE